MISRFMALLFCDLLQPCSDPEVSFMERGASKMEADKVSDGKKPSVTSAKSEELQVHISRQQPH